MLSTRQVEKKAETVLRGAGQDAPSIDVEGIARSLGVTVRYESTNADVSGALFKRGGKAIIGVNPDHPRNRQRFTIAHEVGHFILHRGDLYMDEADAYPNESQGKHRLLRDQVSAQASDPKEIEANRFAAALLMPAFMLKDTLSSYILPLKQKDIEALASEYEVSLQAMAFRLSNLGVPIDVSM
jgi:Zn-dependent peptidase ImmA (M78 family)